ncbi:MAG: diaminopimelate decarboxylase [Bacteroidales bacterium]|nr:diaminopimelate decarboxylase [Bacteroidales bacterium]
MFSNELITQFDRLKTPFYYYDTDFLNKNLNILIHEANRFGYRLHYAVKANANSRILQIISDYGFGADCVSGNEVQKALENGFKPEKIVFAGVGKTDEELQLAIDKKIFCVNCESLQELEIINSLAEICNKKVRVALRINPDIDAQTHAYITTGLQYNKFGLSLQDVDYIIKNKEKYSNLLMDGVHLHIGSQITNLKVFRDLCGVVNNVLHYLSQNNINIQHINLGGGLGIDYSEPENQIPDFQAYFNVFYQHLTVKPWQEIHFEPGRAVIGQAGALITRVLYVKENGSRKTIIVDAGFTDLLRPALYQAKHKIKNISSESGEMLYDIAGPLCETADYFGKGLLLPETKRGDLLVIYSAGAYGEVMASQYNLRQPAGKYFSDDLLKSKKHKISTLKI